MKKKHDSSESVTPDTPSPRPTRRQVLATAALAATAGAPALLATSPATAARGSLRQEPTPASGGDSFELSEWTFDRMQEAMASGERTSKQITELYLGRIAAVDRQGPRLQSLLDLNPAALDIADQLDRERAAGKVRGPLHGLPIVLKDNIDTNDGMTTTAGSLALEGSIAPMDSAVAATLRTAGAVLLAKANLSEWANFRSNRSSSGWSGRGGQCKNPYFLDRNPCGSSSGSGASTSANLCAAAIGTETNGSIVCPANANGLVGLKPTVGLVSRAGIVPISKTQDTAGPMTRTVRDAALLLGGLVQREADPRDAATSARVGAPIDYTAFLDRRALNGKRLGVWRSAFEFDDRVERLGEEALRVLEKSGAKLVDVDFENRREVGDASYQVMLYEFKDGLNAYFASLGPGSRIKSLAELIEFNERNSEREMPWFGQEILLAAQEKGPLSDGEYQDALEKALRLSRAEGLDKLLQGAGLDAIVAPTGGPAWVTDWVNGDHFSGGSSSPAAISGYPNITVPMGNIQGLPVGLSFFGAAWNEGTLLGLAYAFEQETMHRIVPGLKPTLGG